MQRGRTILLILLVLALVGLSLYGICGGNTTTNGVVQCVRDVAIIVLVLETFVATILLLLVVQLFGQLVNTIENKILPILDTAKHTVDTVQGTTTFVSDTLVAPLISIAGFGAAFKGTLAALVGRKQRRKKE